MNCIVNGVTVKRTVENVQYVPGLIYGLLARKSLNQKGIRIAVEDGGCKITHRNGTILAEVLPTSGRLYFLNLASYPITPLPTTTALAATPSFDLIHKRLAHPGKDTLQTMIRKELVSGLKGVPDESKDFTCDVCVRGKMVRGPFQDGHLHANERLGRLHSNVCGPMDVTSLGGNRYFCLLVNDRSGYIWYRPIARKSDFSAWFIKMDNLFLNQFGTHIKTLCSNGGGEYVNDILESYCSSNSIILERSIAHTPEQNGVAE